MMMFTSYLANENVTVLIITLEQSHLPHTFYLNWLTSSASFFLEVLNLTKFKNEVLRLIWPPNILRKPEKLSKNPRESPKIQILHFPHVCRRFIRYEPCLVGIIGVASLHRLSRVKNRPPANVLEREEADRRGRAVAADNSRRRRR